LNILLDECVDVRLAHKIVGHTVKSVSAMGWTGLKNGALLDQAQRDFDVLLTVDKRIPTQQHLSQFHIAILILNSPTNRLEDLLPLLPTIHETLPTLHAGKSAIIG
jgi:hypothetical protein